MSKKGVDISFIKPAMDNDDWKREVTDVEKCLVIVEVYSSKWGACVHVRLTAEEGLPHNLFVQFYDPENIPRAPRQVWIHLDDNQKQSTSMYRDRLYEEITKRGFNRKPGLDAAPTGAAG